MLSLINLSVPHRKTTVVSNLQAVFSEGHVHGLFAPDATQLKPLLECISGQHTGYTGSILYNDGPLAGHASFIDCRHITAASIPEIALVTEHADTSGTHDPSGYELAGLCDAPRKVSGSRLNPSVDFSKDILLLHNLNSAVLHHACPGLPGFLKQLAVAERKIVIISGQSYPALRDTCDYIYLFDKKRFPIVVEKADFAQFDEYFENVFRLYRPH